MKPSRGRVSTVPLEEKKQTSGDSELHRDSSMPYKFMSARVPAVWSMGARGLRDAAVALSRCLRTDSRISVASREQRREREALF